MRVINQGKWETLECWIIRYLSFIFSFKKRKRMRSFAFSEAERNHHKKMIGIFHYGTHPFFFFWASSIDKKVCFHYSSKPRTTKVTLFDFRILNEVRNKLKKKNKWGEDLQPKGGRTWEYLLQKKTHQRIIFYSRFYQKIQIVLIVEEQVWISNTL